MTFMAGFTLGRGTVRYRMFTALHPRLMKLLRTSALAVAVANPPHLDYKYNTHWLSRSVVVKVSQADSRALKSTGTHKSGPDGCSRDGVGGQVERRVQA